MSVIFVMKRDDIYCKYIIVLSGNALIFCKVSLTFIVKRDDILMDNKLIFVMKRDDIDIKYIIILS